LNKLIRIVVALAVLTAALPARADYSPWSTYTGIPGTPNTTAVGSIQGESGMTPVSVSGIFWQSIQPVGQSGTWTVGVSGSVAVTGTFYQTTQPVSQSGNWSLTGPVTAGVTVSKVLTTASTNLTALKTTQGAFYGATLYNTTSSARYIHFYNSSSAVTVGTTVPYFTLGIPPNNDLVVSPSDIGRNFPSGIEYAVTTGYADTDATATAAGDVVGEVDYK
jgi:hypothetical protein